MNYSHFSTKLSFVTSLNGFRLKLTQLTKLVKFYFLAYVSEHGTLQAEIDYGLPFDLHTPFWIIPAQQHMNLEPINMNLDRCLLRCKRERETTIVAQQPHQRTRDNYQQPAFQQARLNREHFHKHYKWTAQPYNQI
jgi:hypothetical protein